MTNTDRPPSATLTIIKSAYISWCNNPFAYTLPKRCAAEHNIHNILRGVAYLILSKCGGLRLSYPLTTHNRIYRCHPQETIIMSLRLRRLSAALTISISLLVIWLPAYVTAEVTAPAATPPAQEHTPAPVIDSLIIQRYRNALRLNPTNSETRFQLGVALLREKRYTDALTELTALSSAIPDNADIRYYLGMAYAGVGELDKALESYEAVVLITAGAAKKTYEMEKAFYNLGIAHQRAEDMTGALKAYKRSIEIAPAQTLAYCRMGEVLFNIKNFNDSLSQFQICDDHTPDDPQTKRNIVSVRLAKGLELTNEKKYTEALTEFRKVAEQDPDNERAVYFQGYLYYQVAEYKQAIATLSKLRTSESPDIYTNLPALLQNIAVELQSREDWAGAAVALQQAVTFKKDDPDLHYLLGYNLMKQDNYLGAQQEIKEALRFNPTHSSSTLALAIISEKLIDEHLTKGEAALVSANYDVADSEFKTALELDPTNARAISDKLIVDAKLSDVRAQAAEKLEQNVSEGLATAEKNMRTEKYKEALAAYRYVLAFDPENQDALQGVKASGGYIREKLDKHMQAGDAFADANKHNLAVKEYRTALTYDSDSTLAKSKLATEEFRLGSLVNPFLDEASEKESQIYLSEAIKAYENALEYDPENITALEGKKRAETNLETTFNERLATGKRALLDRDYVRASKDLTIALRLKPEDADAKDGLAKASEWMDRTIAAKIKAADKSFHDGRYSEAASGYEEVLALDKNNFNAQEGLQNIKRQVADELNKKLASAEASYHQGQYYKAYLEYGEALQLDKNNADARAMRLQSRQKLDESTAPLLKRAVEESSKGDNDNALIDFKKVLNADPSNETAKKYLGTIDKSKAMRSISGKVEKLYLTGVDLYTRGRYVEAIKAWEELLALDPSYEKASRNIKKAKRKLEGVMDVKD